MGFHNEIIEHICDSKTAQKKIIPLCLSRIDIFRIQCFIRNIFIRTIIRKFYMKITFYIRRPQLNYITLE